MASFAKQLIFASSLVVGAIAFNMWSVEKLNKDAAATIERANKRAAHAIQVVEIQSQQEIDAIKQANILVRNELKEKTQEVERLRYVANKQLAILDKERKERRGLRECLDFELDARILQLYQARATNDHSD